MENVFNNNDQVYVEMTALPQTLRTSLVGFMLFYGHSSGITSTSKSPLSVLSADQFCFPMSSL